MKKKGFTLVELLAVIVVLAVIALIAVPIVLNIIKSARKGAAEASARNYIKAVETYAVSSELDKNKTALKNKQRYNVTASTTIDGKSYSPINDLVEIKGTKPNGSEDYVTLDDSNQVQNAKLTINGYEVVIENKEIVSTTNTNKTDVNSSSEDIITTSSGKLEIEGEYQLTINPKATELMDAVTWTSSDTTIAEVDYKTGLLMTTEKIGEVILTATTLSGKKIATNVTVYRPDNYLSDKASVGDYVAYNVSPAGKGWRILSIDKDKHTVAIVHAGAPENYSYGSNPTTGINDLNNIAQKYKDNTYADTAHAMNKSEADAIDQSNSLRAIGSTYFMASKYDNNYVLFAWGDGSFCNYYGNYGHGPHGVRPVIVLKANVKTTGKVKDTVGNDAWNLVLS